MQYFSIISCTLFLTFVVYFPKELSCGEITLKIKNYNSRDGFIHIAIYNNKMDFPKEKGKYLGFKEKANSVIDKGFIIYNLEENNYAIAIYHDENGNNKFDTFFGIPKEKYGFSMNAKVFLSAPSFEDSSFSIKNLEKKDIEIELK